MNQLLQAFSQFNRREQIMLLVGGISLVLYVFWIALLAPLQHKRDNLLLLNIATEQSLGRVQLLARQIEDLTKQSTVGASNNGDNISGLVDASLRDNGLSMGSFTPGSGGEARIRIDKANSTALLQWLYDLEAKHRVEIRELSITASNEPGQVAVNIRLFKP